MRHWRPLLCAVTLSAAALTGVFPGCAGPQPAAPATAPAYLKFPYRDPSLPLEQRVDDLVGRMTLEEKVSQMQQKAPAIERLGVPAYHWWNEALHGVARNGVATVFPQAIGLAATWDTDLHHQIASVIGDETRAKHHQALREGKAGQQYAGLDHWSPNINIFRDPRWGRGQETYGEDPYLTGRMGVAFVEGLQGDDPKYFKAIATPKHFAVHSGPEPERHFFSASPSKADLYGTYLPAFEACIREAGAYSIMGAYNAIDGVPCCADPWLLNTTLREQWGFQGYVVSDVDAVRDVWRSHQYQDTAEAAAAACVRAGCDLNGGETYERLVAAVRTGLINEKEIDRAVRRLMTARFKLGMFDPPDIVPYAQIPYAINDSREHEALARRAASASMVLLKNERGLLPLDRKTIKTIAVIGPTADSLPVLLGNYNGTPARPVSFLQGIRNAVEPEARVLYARGCPLVQEAAELEEVIPARCLFTEALRNAPGLKAEYYRGAVLSGYPALTRIDAAIDFNWSVAGVATEFPREDFCVRWAGVLVPPDTGDYDLGVTVDDGCRLWVDNVLVLDDWAKAGKRSKAARVHLEKDKPCAIRLEYFQGKTDAALQLRWTRPTLEAEGGRFAEALRVASAADVVVCVLGLTPELEGEEMFTNIEGFPGGDRATLDLPRPQEELLEALSAAGKPVVLVLTSGSALSVNWANEHVPAILEAWYPGEQGGNALADLLFGDENPAGRLPVTFYKSVDDLPPFASYAMEGRTYRYFRGQPLYPFGYGLSYTQFQYGVPEAPVSATTAENLSVRVRVKNVGVRAGEEVVQLYVSRTSATAPTPLRSLAGFKRIGLNAGEEKNVEFTLTPLQLAIITPEGKRRVEPGNVTVQVGPHSAEGQTRTVELTGPAAEPVFRFVPPQAR